uniref:Uncharacterized protein n=1 Tax=uncultured marine thaumarchaeote KM3_36_B08 TaxID=1456135 RepID=A0A075H5V6_9ARCH|nr:hypothetical protein [uncultured marine thaumarchaeote KM3_36_B08]
MHLRLKLSELLAVTQHGACLQSLSFHQTHHSSPLRPQLQKRQMQNFLQNFVQARSHPSAKRPGSLRHFLRLRKDSWDQYNRAQP